MELIANGVVVATGYISFFSWMNEKRPIAPQFLSFCAMLVRILAKVSIPLKSIFFLLLDLIISSVSQEFLGLSILAK